MSLKGSQWRGFSKQKLVLQVVEDSKIPLTPKQVYDEICPEVDIKPSTVRKYLRRLYEQEKVLQPYPGYYCNSITYGMIKGELRVHNVFFSVDAPFLKRFSKIGDITELTGDVKLFVQFGKQRRNLSGKISNDVPGMAKDTLLFALNRVLDLMEDRTRQVVSEGFTLTSFETNRDYPGKRLDGEITCLTKKQLFEVIERIYQKDDDTVRCERKISSDLKVEEAVALLRNEPNDPNIAQGLFVVKERIEALTLRTQFFSRELVEINKRSDFLASDVHLGVVDLSKRVDALTENLVRIVDALNGINGKPPVSSSAVVEPADPTYIS